MKNERALPAIIPTLYRPTLRFQAISSLNHLRVVASSKQFSICMSHALQEIHLQPDFGTHDLRAMVFATKILAKHGIAGPDEKMQKRK